MKKNLKILKDMLIKELDTIIKEVFNESLVTTVDSVYELSDDEDYYKLVISLHGLDVEDTIIVHTKFIFKTNLDKTELINNSFTYLYDLNCIYHLINFSDSTDLKEKMENVIHSNDFGIDIKNISEFLSSPISQLNDYLSDNKIENLSVYEVKYNPKYKIIPCSLISFDFDININNIYTIKLSIKKEEKEKYKFTYKIYDDILEEEFDTLKSLSFNVGSSIVKLMKKFI